jgi:hypothetical protein
VTRPGVVQGSLSAANGVDHSTRAIRATRSAGVSTAPVGETAGVRADSAPDAGSGWELIPLGIRRVPFVYRHIGTGLPSYFAGVGVLAGVGAAVGGAAGVAVGAGVGVGGWMANGCTVGVAATPFKASFTFGVSALAASAALC